MQDIPRETLLAFPELYKSGPKNRFFTRHAFMGWWLVAVFHSAVIFMGVVFCLDRSVIHGNGQVRPLCVCVCVVEQATHVHLSQYFEQPQTTTNNNNHNNPTVVCNRSLP